MTFISKKRVFRCATIAWVAAMLTAGATAKTASAQLLLRIGAVYTQTNESDGNAIAAFARRLDGTLDFIGNFPTGGLGSTEFDGGEGLDPLISADSIIVTPDSRFLITVNAGSDSITSFEILGSFGLRLVSTVSSGGVGPNSLTYRDGQIFVSNIDRDGLALGQEGTVRAEPNDEGNVVGFTLDDSGQLSQIPGSVIELDNRPANLGFSTDGKYLIVTSINAGSAELPGDDADNSIIVYSVDEDGLPIEKTGFSRAGVGNDEGRNLPSAIDFDVTRFEVTPTAGFDVFVVTEAREFSSEGAPPTLGALQAGSITVFILGADGNVLEQVVDVPLGDPTTGPFEEGNQLTTCWIDFAENGTTFYVSNAINASISSFNLVFDGLNFGVEPLQEVAAQGTSGFENGATTGPEVFDTTDGFIDLDITEDGRFLYQLAGLDGSIQIYEVEESDGSLEFVGEASGFLPEVDTQGLVTVTSPTFLRILAFIEFLLRLLGF